MIPHEFGWQKHIAKNWTDSRLTFNSSQSRRQRHLQYPKAASSNDSSLAHFVQKFSVTNLAVKDFGLVLLDRATSQ